MSLNKSGAIARIEHLFEHGHSSIVNPSDPFLLPGVQTRFPFIKEISKKPWFLFINWHKFL